ncbi:MAG: SRPBCC domain-containing protein [Caldilineaceae bacterium]
MTITQAPVAKAAMLIRKPVADVFAAFVDPAITTQFWFTKSSGKLEAGQQVEWTWEMYNVSTKVDVKVIEPNQRILIEWGGPDAPTTVEWIFTPRADNTTFVSITNRGFQGAEDEIVQQALDSTGGFTLVLAGAKALLEHNTRLNLVGDRFPADVSAPPSARVTRRFNASPERVFDAWLDPSKINGFLFGPNLRDEEVVRIAVDPRVGGRFSFVVRRQGQEIDHVGEYLEINRPCRLAFTWGTAQDGSSSRVMIEIVPLKQGCELTLTHELEPAWADFVDRAKESWAKMVDALGQALDT